MDSTKAERSPLKFIASSTIPGTFVWGNEPLLCWLRFPKSLSPNLYRSWFFTPWLVLFSMMNLNQCHACNGPVNVECSADQWWWTNRRLLVLESLVLRGIACETGTSCEMGERSGTYGVNEKSREIGKNGEKNPTRFFQGQSSNRQLCTSDRKNLYVNGFVSEWYSRLICIYSLHLLKSLCLYQLISSIFGDIPCTLFSMRRRIAIDIFRLIVGSLSIV